MDVSEKKNSARGGGMASPRPPGGGGICLSIQSPREGPPGREGPRGREGVCGEPGNFCLGGGGGGGALNIPRGPGDRKNSFSLERMKKKKTIPPRTKCSYSRLKFSHSRFEKNSFSIEKILFLY